MMVFVLTYDLTVSPVCYCLVAEMSSIRFRIKIAPLAHNAYLIACLVANFLNPPILNPSAWNLRGKGGFIWAALSFYILTWFYFRLPETMDRSSAELDVLFERRVANRKFSSTTVDSFHGVEAEKAEEMALGEVVEAI